MARSKQEALWRLHIPFAVPVARCDGSPARGSLTSDVHQREEVPFGSIRYFALCGLGGALACSIPHLAVTPLDVIKCRIQTNSTKYKGLFSAFGLVLKEDGARGLFRGWSPTFVGYFALGVFKFGLYEAFKIRYADILGEEKAYLWRTVLHLGASASAEFFADIALSPFEACKVRIQTQPGCSPYLTKVFLQISHEEGLRGFYKGLGPLWMRQIPYTMMKFASFERTLELLYRFAVPKPRDQCSKGEQLIITFTAGYIAGVLCTLVSHPADTIVSKLNQEKGSSAIECAKKLGFFGLWRGLSPRIVMSATLTAMQWFIYDAVKVWFHLPRPPPPVMPESLRNKLHKLQQ